ncbi:hypothetical protein [Staphylococcus aureus]|nr:hypothetical protein [Staphylococcus aureus]
MGGEGLELGLRGKDELKVMEEFDLNRNDLEVLNGVYRGVIGREGVGL